MRMIPTIDQPKIIKKILKHLGLWLHQAYGPPISEEGKIVEEMIYDYSFFDYLPS